MPRTKTPAKKQVAKKKPVKSKIVNQVVEHKPVMGTAVCRTCHALPVGSIELVSLLLVLVFSLTAVLVTSVHALTLQQQQIDHLEAKIAS